MPHFYHKKGNLLLSTNYKVMYSSLSFYEDLTEVSFRKLIDLKLKARPREHILVARNPYERLKSLFKDKFIKYPLSIINNKTRDWQHFHKVLFPILNIDESLSWMVIANRLSKIDINEFVKILPFFYKLDAHNFPQHWIRFASPRIKIPIIRFSKILKMESSDDMNLLSEIYGLDLSLKHNSTSEVNCDTNLYADSIKIINFLYKIDFDLFGYSKLKNTSK